jgi:molybdenum cofactor cytidylyltransferase
MSVGAPAPVGTVILAAGLSTRMGRFKLTLPWDGTTVIGRVVQILVEAGLEDIVVVTGHRAGDVTKALTGVAVREAYNPGYGTGEMLSSIRVGLAALRGEAMAALVCLGDQPQIEVATVRAVLATGREDGWRRLVVPSYGLRAGHPILLPRGIWPRVLAATGTLRDVLKAQHEEIRYVAVGTPTVLADLDTPQDYEGKA